MADLVQTHAAPDLVTFDKIDIVPKEMPDGTRDVVRVGKTAVPMVKVSATTIAITIEDLRTIIKAGYILGWNGKAIHRKDLIEKMTAEIGT